MAGGNGQGRDDAFYAAVLTGIGAPVNSKTVTFMRAWAKLEGGSASWNPFNTTAPMPGATSYNSVGVRNYASRQDGITATIRTLVNSGKGTYYKGIIAALRRNDPRGAVAALVASPWSGSHYGAPRKAGGGWDYTKTSIYKVWAGMVNNPADDPTGKGADDTGYSGAVAYYDPNVPNGGALFVDGKWYVPKALWEKDYPASVRKQIKIVTKPGFYADYRKGLDAGGVTPVESQFYDDNVAPAIDSVAGLAGWIGTNLPRIGLGALGVLVLIFGVIYANKGNIKDAVSVAAAVV